MSSSEWTESLIAERVAQLDAIIQRRNALLREMYHMMQQKHNVGVLALDEIDHGNDDEDEGLKQFMDRFDLGKDQESGMISNLSDDELSVPFPSEDVTEEHVESAVPDLDSPMSEPPVSPARTRSPVQKEEDEEAEINDLVEAVAQVDLPTSHPPTPSVQQPSEAQEKEEEEEEGEEGEGEEDGEGKGEGEGEREKEKEEEQALRSDHCIFAPPSPRPPSRPASTTLSYHSPAVSRHCSRFPSPSPPIPLQSPQPVNVQPVTEVEMDTSEPMEDVREESPQLVLPSSPVVTQTAEIYVQSDDTSADILVETAPSPSPVHEAAPRPMVIHTAVDVASLQPSLLIPTPTSPAPALPDFSFEDTEGENLDEPAQATVLTGTQHHHFNPNYNLPPLKALPPEYLRKGKSSKQKKKDKDKADTKGGKEEWAPLGFAKWGATVRANPIYKKVSRATKCLSTNDWSVAVTELRLLRTLERVESLENVAKWSYRQPKKQRNLGGMTRTHWDYLLDEIKWMRVDFREERRWKHALAFNISTAVLEWHDAETREERVKLGICMHWKPPRTTDSASSPSQQRQQQQDMDVDNEGVASEQCGKEQTYSDQESGDDDDEGEVEQRDIVDALETRNALEEALEGNGSRSGSGESRESSQRQSMDPDGVLRPKVEDVDDPSALGNVSGAWQRDEDAMDVDQPREGEGNRAEDGDVGRTQTTKTEVVDLAGLKPDSSDPVLGSQTGSESQNSTLPVPSPSKSAPKSNLYAPLRERIAYSDDSKLFLDNDDLDLVKALSDLTTQDSSPPTLDLEAVRSLDLSDLFPDLQVLGMPDVAPSEPKKRSDKKSERDDNRRVDDAGYTRIAPVGRFMLSKPTLLSPLQPVRRWKKGKWLSPEEPAVTEAESLSSKITNEQLSELFDGVKPQAIGGTFVPHPLKDNKKRLDHAWSPSEDALLKSFVEKYPSNWALVADSFNSARVTIPIDKRTPWECFERWSLKLGGKPSGVPGHTDVTSPAGVEGTPPPPTPTTSTQQAQMTTRGVKRLANINIAQGGAGATGVTVSSDTIKRRRHSLMYETIRKTAKRREAAQKAASMNQRKPPNIHDTHGQYNKMPKLTPAELSRMKAEKESRDQQEMLMARRRHEELTRQQLLRAQQQPVAAAASAQQQQQQPQQPQQPQPQQPQQQQPGNGVSRPAAQPAQPAPQIRAQSAVPQVNISQQQRMPTPMSAAARMSPQQMLQVQAAQARASAITAVTQSQVHAQLQAQVQIQAQAQGTPQAALASLPAGTHLSPPYQSRAATSSPGISVTQQASPPRTAVTPSNVGVAASPRPPSAQPQPPMPSPQIAGNTMPRPASSIAAHYLPVVPSGPHFTQEQMDQALRLSSLMQRSTMAQAQQGGQYPSQS
ncbi:hypothetical protein L210DRAFT_866921 [Boletus edulis BED1]|uniref:Vacuolar import and degradation protein 21 n=1 Tax=Boletus edulis BED1 TaxID=1328754 RepID=A0AAD4GA96_BOLED|nr:hypothetical protein L210DRAFT_866921 [Boletus edulis BED1]